ncbi:MAG: hypothetical protein P8Y70_14040 [Candidatus Lokiarchaeota archaeon]
MKNKAILILVFCMIGGLCFTINPELSYASPDSSEYKAGFFTLHDIIIFSYNDGLEYSIFDSTGVEIITGVLDKGEHEYYQPGEGVYSIIGNKPYSVMTGDPINNYVCGYFSADDSYRGVANEFYTYTARDQDVIVFAYSSGITNVYAEYWDEISDSWVYLDDFSLGGPGEHYYKPYPSWSSEWLHFTSDQPISVQCYSDRCFFVPDESGLWSGTHFYLFAGWYGGGDNLHIHSYEESNDITVKYIGGSTIWSGTLNDGEWLNLDYSTIGVNTYIEVISTGIITVSDEPYWLYDYYGLLTVPDETGTGVGTKFYTYAREYPPGTIGSIWIYAYNEDTNVEIKDMDTGTIMWSGVLNENEFYKYTPPSGIGGHLFGIFSDDIVSVVEGSGGWGAEFVPLLYAAELFTIEKDFRYTNVDFTPFHWEDPDGIPCSGDEYIVQDPAVLGDLIPQDVDGNYIVDLVVHEKTSTVKSTNPGQIYGVTTITGPVSTIFIEDNFDKEFDINPDHLGGGIEIVVVDPDGYATVITHNPGISVSIHNDDPSKALIDINLEIAWGGILEADYKLMIYVKFKTAMKHQVFPDPIVPYDYEFWNTPSAWINDMEIYVDDPYEFTANIIFFPK